MKRLQDVKLPLIDKLIGRNKELDPKGRSIFVNDAASNKPFKYASNYITTSKYTALTFLPLSLFEQFCRLANVYFLIISGLQQIPGISPTGRWTTLGPLIFVLAVTMLKEGFEDVKRHIQDREINNSKTEVLRGKDFVTIKWLDVKTGDIVRISNRQYIPADVVLLCTSEPSGICYIETANLDGETNLKIRQSLEETGRLDNAEALSDFTGEIRCEHPNNRLNTYEGNITFGGTTYSLGPKQLLPRGAMLRNTKWVHGVVVFTGADTKLMRNQRKTPMKRSNVERTTNKLVIMIFGFELLLCAFCAVGNYLFSSTHQNHWYLRWSYPPSKEAGLSFMTFLILYNNLIPISLYVSVEIVKVIQAFLIDNDLHMYYPKNDTPARARTSNLNEELGQVSYVFSDKTGTLTQNLMQFHCCSIAGISYGGATTKEGSNTTTNTHLKDQSDNNSSPFVSFSDVRLQQNLAHGPNAEIIREFISLLAVCHTVVPETDTKDPNKIIYQASSPDENALVSAAKSFGYEFVARTPKTVTIHVHGKPVRYELLNVLEFNSDRKRMSVIVRTPEGKILLYCKGADTAIYKRLGPEQPYGDITISHLQDFANDGLRTLCLAVAELDPVQYEEWNKLFMTAINSISNRDEEVDRVSEIIEKNLFLLGATAIEDKLQDGVPETIRVLLDAGIKIWVLTGDKQETAINISYSCELLTDSMELIIVNEGSLEATRDQIVTRLEQCKKAPGTDYALIIDGASLIFALEDNLRLRFLELGALCKSVVCCRVSPLQKALVVKLVRDNLNAISLAIGDGANDVSMIQAAHVGVGISGEEGLQAARAADYAIAQFRFLQRLLLFHGRHSYRRISKLILYCFYRNIALYLTQFWFTIFNGWSGQTFYERFTLTAYNILWTFFPVIIMGIFDKDVGDAYLLEHPRLYEIGKRRGHFNFRIFLGWFMNAIFHSLILFGFVALAFSHGLPYSNGRAVDLFEMGTVSYSCVVITVNLKLALETRTWTWVNHLATWGSLLAYLIWLMVYGVFFDNPSVDAGSDIYYVIFHLFATPLFYFSVIIVPMLCLWRDFSWKFLLRTNLPHAYHIIQEMESVSSGENELQKKAGGKIKHYTGYSFSQEAGQASALRNANFTTAASPSLKAF